jgi:hypothetical protein
MKTAIKFGGKFAAIGFVATIISYVVGLDGKTAADVAVTVQMIWVGFQLA